MPTLDRNLSTARKPVETALSCWLCSAGQHTVSEQASPDAARPPRFYLHGGLSPHAIGEIAGLNRQRATRALRKPGVPLRLRDARRPRTLRQDGYADLLITPLYNSHEAFPVPPAAPVRQRFPAPVC